MLLKQLSLKIRIKDRSFRNNVYFMFYDTYWLIEKNIQYQFCVQYFQNVNKLYMWHYQLQIYVY